MDSKEQLIKEKLPRHVAIIMDGNGRWAKKRGLARIAGHKEGVESVRDVVEAAVQLGVQYLTLYAFSTENWKRPQEEVSLLMRLLLRALHDEADRLHRNNVRLQAIGDVSRLPAEVQNELLDGIQKTKENTGLTLVLALSYSGRWDLTEAVRKIAADVRASRLVPDQISEQTLHRPFAIVVLRARTNRMVDLLPLVPRLRAALKRLTPGTVFDVAG